MFCKSASFQAWASARRAAGLASGFALIVPRHRRAPGALRSAARARAAAATSLPGWALPMLAACRRFAGQPVGYSSLFLAAGLPAEYGDTALWYCQRAGLVSYTSATQPLIVHRRPSPLF